MPNLNISGVVETVNLIAVIILSKFCFMCILDAASDHGENAGEVFEEEERK